MEEQANPTSQEAGKSVLGPAMWLECLRLVVAPRIARTVEEYPDIENRQQLHRAFCEKHKVRPSYSTFSGWCEDLGINFRKRIEVNIPGWREMPRPNPEFIGPMPAAPTQPMQTKVVPVVMQEEDEDAPVNWDTKANEESSTMPFNEDGIPTILPGGMRLPSFLDNGNYGN